MSKRICFTTYGDWEELFQKLDAKSFRELMLAVFSYGLRKEVPSLSPVTDLLFASIKPVMERDWEKYEKIVERNKSNSKNAGRKPKQSKEKSENPINPVDFLDSMNNSNNPVDKSEIQTPQIINKEIINNEINDNDTVSFDTFWDLYDKKVDRGACLKKWNKLSKADKEAAIAYIPKYKEAQPDKQFRKNPETFLNRRAWENEIIFREEDNGINSGVIQKEGFEWKQ